MALCPTATMIMPMTRPHTKKLFARGLFAQEGRGERTVSRPGLQDQGGKAGGHSEVQCEVDERELAHGHEHPMRTTFSTRFPGADEEHGRECNENESHCGEQQRGNVGQASVDDYEVGAPDNRHKDAKAVSLGFMSPTLSVQTRNYQRTFHGSTM